MQPQLDCNWVAAMENSVDPVHNEILHQDAMRGYKRKPASTTRGFIDDVAYYDFYTTSYGIMKQRAFKEGLVEEHPIIFPNILRINTGTMIRVPIDDTHTTIFTAGFRRLKEGESMEEDETSIPVHYNKPFKDPPDALHPFTRFDLTSPESGGQHQDHMAWETQGLIADRTVEHTSYSDRGVVMYREMLLENIERVQQGLDPMCVIRDPDHPIIDTGMEASRKQRALRDAQPIGRLVT